MSDVKISDIVDYIDVLRSCINDTYNQLIQNIQKIGVHKLDGVSSQLINDLVNSFNCFNSLIDSLIKNTQWEYCFSIKNQEILTIAKNINMSTQTKSNLLKHKHSSTNESIINDKNYDYLQTESYTGAQSINTSSHANSNLTKPQHTNNNVSMTNDKNYDCFYTRSYSEAILKNLFYKFNNNFDRKKIDAAYRIDKENHKSHYLKGVSLFESRNQKLALNEFKIAICLNPDDKKSEDQIQKIKINNENIDNFNKLTQDQFEQGQYEQSLTQAEKVLSIDPKNIEALINKAVNLIFLQRQNESLAYIEIVLSIDPKDLKALLNKALNQHCLQRQKESLACIKKVLSIDPKNKIALNYKKEFSKQRK